MPRRPEPRPRVQAPSRTFPDACATGTHPGARAAPASPPWRLRVSTRLLIACALFLLPVAVLFCAVYSTNAAMVAFTRDQIRGAASIEALRRELDGFLRGVRAA